MPKNPNRAGQGGDVSGTEKTDPDMGTGDPIEVSSASYDPGYELDASMELSSGQARFTKADLKRGYAQYGIGVGDPGSDKAR